MPVGPAAPVERLTVATIVATAETLLAAEGVEGLSMRKLAKACGVGVMTLYGHVRTKDDLLAALAERALACLELPAANAGHWTYRVAAVFHALRRALLEHPELLGVMAAGRVETVTAYRGAEIGLGALRETGLDEAQIVHAWRTLTSFTVGACQHEVGLTVRRDRTGHVAGLTGFLADRDWDAEFAAGLDLLITGLHGWAEHARAGAELT